MRTFAACMLFVCLAVVADGQNTQTLSNVNLKGSVDSSGATSTKPFRIVATDQSGSCSVNRETVQNDQNGKLFSCIAGAWQQVQGTGTGGGVADPGAAGVVVRTTLNTTVARTVAGVAGHTTVSNSDGQTAGPIVVDSVPNPQGQVIPIGFMLGSDDGAVLVDTNDQKSIFSNQLGFGVHVVRINCKTNTGTAIINIQRNDGTPANILSSNLTCSTTGATSTAFVAGEDAVAFGDDIDLLVVTAAASGAPQRISVFGALRVD